MTQKQLDVQTDNEKEAQQVLDKNYQDSETEEAFIFHLTEQEKAIAAQNLTDLNKTVKNLEDQKKKSSAHYNSELKSNKADIDAICKKVADGEEKVVACIKRVHFGHQKVYFLTLDGKTQIHERAMLDEERQLNLVETPPDESLVVNSGEGKDDGFALDGSDGDSERVTEKTLTENTSVCF